MSPVTHSASENQSCPFSPNGIVLSLLFLYNLATLKYKQPIKTKPMCLFSPLVWDWQNLIFPFPTWAWDQLQIKGVCVNLQSPDERNKGRGNAFGSHDGYQATANPALPLIQGWKKQSHWKQQPSWSTPDCLDCPLWAAGRGAISTALFPGKSTPAMTSASQAARNM